MNCSSHLNSLIHQPSLGLSLGLKPKPTEDGTGGTYLLRSAQKQFIGVFKPKDEELVASENPRGYNGSITEARAESSKECRGIVPSEGAIREVAAFLIDSNRFHSVPQTTYVSVSRSFFDQNNATKMSSQPQSGLTAALHKQHNDKIGSFQEYIESDDTAGDLSSSLFAVREVHKIAILDIRILNVDRNESKILDNCSQSVPNTRSYQSLSLSRSSSCDNRPTLQLIHIDHSRSLPDQIELAWDSWCWLEWSQLKEPLDAETKQYVADIDILADLEVLRNTLGIRDLRVMRISSLCLRKESWLD